MRARKTAEEKKIAVARYRQSEKGKATILRCSLGRSKIRNRTAVVDRLKIGA